VVCLRHWTYTGTFMLREGMGVGPGIQLRWKCFVWVIPRRGRRAGGLLMWCRPCRWHGRGLGWLLVQIGVLWR